MLRKDRFYTSTFLHTPKSQCCQVKKTLRLRSDSHAERILFFRMSRSTVGMSLSVTIC